MIDNSELIKNIVVERPVGTEGNDRVGKYIENIFLNDDYKVDSIYFDCLRWNEKKSLMQIKDETIEIKASPFSQYYKGICEGVFIKSVEELRSKAIKGKIVLLYGEIAKTSIQPKNYPFYYPDEHKEIISLLEQKKPQAIISFTGKNTYWGLSPFYMFEDGNFKIPSAYLSDKNLEKVMSVLNKDNTIELCINSDNTKVKSRQLVCSRKGHKNKGKIIVCAHMDSKYNTPGALDNGAGTAVLINTAHILKDEKLEFDIDFVPINTEEYFGADGELKYMEYLKSGNDNVKFVINIDSPGNINSCSAISYYNLNNNESRFVDEIIDKNSNIEKGECWYSGDHSVFAAKDIPCIAVTCSDFYNGGLKYTHSEKDTLDKIDPNLITSTSKFLAELIIEYCRKN